MWRSIKRIFWGFLYSLFVTGTTITSVTGFYMLTKAAGWKAIGMFFSALIIGAGALCMAYEIGSIEYRKENKND